MKKISFLSLLTCFVLLLITTACKKKGEPTPPVAPVLLFKGVWKPGTVLLNNTGSNLAATGQPYANFQLTIDGTTDDNGTYTVSGMPLPFPSTFTGNWARVGTTFTFSTGAPNGITALTNFGLNGSAMTFVCVQASPKVNVTLHFTLNKQ